MAVLKQYSTPAYVVDFPNNASQQAEMDTQWSDNINRWVGAAQIGDIYDLENHGPRPAFYNPLATDVPDSALVATITWAAFPGRFSALFPNDAGQWNHWSDYGDMPPITTDLCSASTISPIPYGPTGPRGWQDEYCEWSVARDSNGNITSVMFTCENPEYWLTLWNCDPNAVLAQYQSLVSPKVTLLDLALLDVSGQPVIDPATGRWAYNPLNKWNNGPHRSADSGGAVHLTSSPNTLGAEFDLAACATMPRTNSSGPVKAAAELVCCALYGRIGRHSDPTIGQNVNAVVNYSGLQGALLTLTDPPGLYMQTPDFSAFQTPDGSDPASYWTVVRGKTKKAGDPIDRILHATYAVPAEKGFTVSDITIAGQKIQYGGQIVGVIEMALLGTAFPSGGPNQAPVGCTADLPEAQVIPWAQALQDVRVFGAYRNLESAQNELPMSVPVLALPVAQGATVGHLALPLNIGSPPASPDLVTVTVTTPGVSIAVDSIATDNQIVTLIVTVTASSSAAVGDCGIIVDIQGSPTSPEPAIGLLTIIPAASSAASAPSRPRVLRMGMRA